MEHKSNEAQKKVQDFNALASDDQQTSKFILFANKPPMAMNQKN